MGKPTPRRIASDGCAVRVGGEVCYPHEGEWVELVPAETVGELRVRVRYASLGAQVDGIRGEPNEGARLNTLMDEHYSEIMEHLAERVFAWNWTDLKGRPLPPPADDAGNPLGLLKIRSGELYWLMNATEPEPEDERKNA